MRDTSSPFARKVAFAPVLVLALALVSVASLSADRRSDSKEQVDFGIELAQKGLWKEAAFRWEKAVELDPTYASAWNNLGIAYEQQGDFPEAKKAYDKAQALDPQNNFIRQNFDMFMEIYDRQNRRRNS
ncbi:MAG: tetratricopeptide repeat protein [Acidobacteria bacterium]|jgi:Flp pilus assembly protein TadD|nr:tetratricopeptide repeat protein [Acidobacteriota bacterium]